MIAFGVLFQAFNIKSANASSSTKWDPIMNYCKCIYHYLTKEWLCRSSRRGRVNWFSSVAWSGLHHVFVSRKRIEEGFVTVYSMFFRKTWGTKNQFLRRMKSEFKKLGKKSIKSLLCQKHFPSFDMVCELLSNFWCLYISSLPAVYVYTSWNVESQEENTLQEVTIAPRGLQKISNMVSITSCRIKIQFTYIIFFSRPENIDKGFQKSCCKRWHHHKTYLKVDVGWNYVLYWAKYCIAQSVTASYFCFYLIFVLRDYCTCTNPWKIISHQSAYTTDSVVTTHDVHQLFIVFIVLWSFTKIRLTLTQNAKSKTFAW